MAKPLRGECEVELGGEKFTLRLGIGELEELDSLTGLGTLELLRSFGTNAKISNVIAVLGQSLQLNGKRAPIARVRQIVEKAGFRDATVAATTVLTACLLDPSEGNAGAAGEMEAPSTPAA